MVVLRQETERSPLITLDGNTLSITGRSFMENSREFYKSFFEEAKKLNFDELTVIIDMDYFNSNSSKWLLEFFYFLADNKSKGANTRIVWKYKKKYPDMLDAGEEFKNSLGRLIQFDIVSKD